MDPVSFTAAISSLIIAVEQIVVAIYKYSRGVKGAKKEINRLSSELFALKAALEHVRMDLENSEDEPSSYPVVCSPISRTGEFCNTLSTTALLLKDLFQCFEKTPRHLNAALRSLGWPLTQDDVRNKVQQLERLKSYFVFAITIDNL